MKNELKKLSEIFKAHVEQTDPSGDPWKIGLRVQTTTDENRIIHSQWDFDSYTEQFGDVEVEYDEKFNTYRVPAFKVERDSYIKGKAAVLASSSYGCE
jgi:hypothetical protein